MCWRGSPHHLCNTLHGAKRTFRRSNGYQASRESHVPLFVNVTVPDLVARPSVLDERRRQLLVAAYLLLVFAGTGWAQGSASGLPADPSDDRVVVVPPRNITGEADDAWIGAGIAETLIADMQAEPGVTVIDRELVHSALGDLPSAVTPDDDAATLTELGRRVGARWLITGGYQRLGDRIRITAWLIEVPSGRVARSAKVDGAVADLFELQDQVSRQLRDRAVVSAATDRPVEPVAPVRPARQRPEAWLSPLAPGALAAAPATVAAVPAVPPNLVGDGNGEGVPGGVAAIPSTVNTGGAALLAMIDGPPPPVPPEVINRDAAGRATIRAIRLDQGIQLDGRLDEPVYETVPPITDFVQQSPEAGAPATEETEAWVMFDQTSIYVSGRVWDSAPPSQWVMNEMRRDTTQGRQNDIFTVMFDTFYDHRNGVGFYTNPVGGFGEFQITNEGNPNNDWNPVWDVRTGRFEGGWTVEMEIPFKSLRYRPGVSQIWGFQIRRNIRRKNEFTHMTSIPISLGDWGGIFRVSYAPTLIGLEVPEAGNNLQIKPYGIGGVTTDVTSDLRNARNGEFGLDAKYGITQNLTADFTYNTDFAQVEVDEQQVNLTRFSLFFPEKREFFLEGGGIFDFAQGGLSGRRGLRRTGGGRGGGDRPTMFFSRRIGFESGGIVPILGGARITGKAGPFDVGALSIQSDESLDVGTKSTNFSVFRVKRDIFRRSSVGGLFTNRSVSLAGEGANQAFGVDGTFSFYDNVSAITYFAQTKTPGVTERDKSYQAEFAYNGDRYGLTANHLVVEDNFIPEVGFVRRDNFRLTSLSARFSPRPRSIELVRQFTFGGQIDYFITADRRLLETRSRNLRFDSAFENSDRFGASLTNNYELLVEPFEISDGVTLPVGGYGFTNAEVSYSFGSQRRVSGDFSFTAGDFWSGKVRTLAYSRGRVSLVDQVSVEPAISFNWVDLPEGSFNTNLVSTRFNYTFTPRMFFSGLVQYDSNSDTWSNNLRLRWEYSPGSELFVVYTEDRDTDPFTPDRFSELRNRGFVVKMTRLFRF